MKEILLKVILVFLIGNTVVFTAQGLEEKSPLAEAKKAHQIADSKMNRVYQATKRSIENWQFKKLKTDQREWLEYRDYRSEAARERMEMPELEGSQKALELALWEMLAELTENRTRMIAAWKQAGASGMVPWAGLWTDGRGAWLRAAVDDSGRFLYFQIDVVRGPAAHIGEIVGKAGLNDSLAFFTDKGAKEKEIGDPETWLVFERQFDGPQLEIKGVNTMFYHGVRAYFSGDYTRLRDLNVKERKAVLEGKSYMGVDAEH